MCVFLDIPVCQCVHIKIVGVCVCVLLFCACVCPGRSRGVARGRVMRRGRDLVFGVSVRQIEVG